MNVSSLHEWVDLAKGLAWPCAFVYCATRYSKEIKIILRVLGASLERVKTAKAFGVELEIEELKVELQETEVRVTSVSVKQPPVPKMLERSSDD